MSAALTINESKLLAKLIDSFKDKDKLNDEHTLIKALSKKSSLSDSDVKKLKLLLAAEKSKILAKENKRKAKAAVKLDQQERQSYIENRQKRFGMVFIEELKKLVVVQKVGWKKTGWEIDKIVKCTSHYTSNAQPV